MQTEQLLYNENCIFYRKTGSGPVVMLLHGFGEDGEIWKEQYNIFPGYTLLVPDLPGSGRSEAVEEMSMEGLAAVVKAIIDKEGGEAILIGHSMGGYITLAVVEKYPALLKGFGLFHSSAFADSEEKKETRQKGIRFIQEHSATEFLRTATPNLYAPSTRERHP